MSDRAGQTLSAPDLPLLTTGPLWLLFFLALFLAGWWWWNRHRRNSPRSADTLSIQILATRPLGPRSHLAIVEAAGQRSLIATTAQGVHFLRDLPGAPEEAATAEHDFARHLDPAEGGR